MSVILSIDPGTSLSAYLVMETEDYKILDKGKVANDVLIGMVRTGYFDMLAIEGFQSFGMPVGKEVFDTAYYIGRLMQIAEDLGSKVRMVYRSEVKLHHCLTPRAKDANIRQAMLDRFGVQGTKKNPGPLHGVTADIFSALAIAAYVADTEKK